MTADLPLPLADLQVLDLTRGDPSVCARILSQLGASVRSLDPGAGSLLLDQALSGAELVLSDLQPAEAARFDLPLGSLARRGLVEVSITPFGLSGPDADRVAGGPILDNVRPDVVATLVGAHASLAALAALRWSRQRRRGLLVEVAALEVLASCLGASFPLATCPRSVTAPPDRADRAISVLPCSDGYVGVTAPTAVDRQLLAGLTGLDALADESIPLAPLLEPWLRTKTRAEVFESAQLWRLPVVPALTPAETLCDEQSVARHAWSTDAGHQPRVRSPFRFTPSAQVAPRPARLGRLPLSDLVVLDLGQVWSGPYCGRLLAGLGARVLKLEAPQRPDGTRPASPRDCQGVFADLNCGKASLALDLASPAGRELFLRLIAQADLLLENFSPRVMPNFGLDYPSLAAVNPALLMLSMPAFGASGPWANYVAYGSGLELATGLAAHSADGRPEPTSVAYLDYLAGCYGAVGALAALLARDQTSRGGQLEVAQREVACQVLATARAEPPVRPGLAVDPTQVAADPQLAARGLLAGPPAPGQPCHHFARLPFLLHGLPERRARPAPSFGQDSRRVLRRDLGLPSEDLAALIRAGVVGAAGRAESRP